MQNKTTNRILTAFEKVLKTQSFEKISVLDICKECGIVPQTFYNHFHSKYDLIMWSLSQDILSAFNKDHYEYSVKNIEAMLTQLAKRKPFYKKIYATDYSNYFDESMNRLNINLANKIIKSYSKHHSLTKYDELLIQYHMYGIMRIFKLWIFGCTAVSTLELAKFQYSETPDILKRAISNYTFNSDDFYVLLCQ
ncbi:TetR family transcriptional regulator [Nicoliella lavandulae]|uniref:TetR family transcriptional regulator n=1 Tax=Nicoliella lavandulae TaxID=3082954 RepID=A0ABU8SM37_9LACO